MIRVGDTYYIANSTFEWWPGVRLHESKDMVHWRLLPSPLNRRSQIDMRGNPSSGGVWAPDLSYADGKFWLVYSDVKIVNGAFKDCTNYLVTAEDIRGPWSEPIRINGVGFDASLFHDDDGRKYLVQQTWDFREYNHPFDGITLTEFDVETMRLRPETERTIWRGTDVKLVEGPHLYKINGMYYLFSVYGLPYWVAAPICILLVAALGAALHFLVIEPLLGAPRTTRSSATSTPRAAICRSRGMAHSWIRHPANGTTRRCVPGPGTMRTNR